MTAHRKSTTAAVALATVALVGTTASTAASADSGSAAAALPKVNHERVLLAAQLDPSNPGRAITPGAGGSVKAVKSALHAKGLLAKSDKDGHWGKSVTDAWRKWEDKVHSTNNPWSSNGLPGEHELEKLAPKRFTLTARVKVGDWVKEDGESINTRTRAMFREAEKLSKSNMVITQGRGNASASAGTHLGGGAIDIRTVDAPGKTDARVKALRQVGFAAWYRNWSGNQHIHAVAVADPWVSYAAHRDLCQIYQHRFGGEGGSCSNSTAGKDRPLIWWEQYKRK